MENNKEQNKDDEPKKELRKVLADEIIEKINKGEEVKYEYCEIDGLDFSNIKNNVEKDGFIYTIVDVPITFTNCHLCNFISLHTRYLKSVVFTHTYFTEAGFTGSEFLGANVDFSYTQFNGRNVCFRFSIFTQKNTSFKEAKFLAEHNTFHNAQFSGENTDFSNAKFSGNNNFYQTQFNGKKLTFIGTEFTGEMLDFKGAKFRGKFQWFKGVKFSCKRNDFEKTLFKGKYTDFGVSQFKTGYTTFFKAKFQGENTYFNNVQFSGKSTFSYAEFIGKNVYFDNAKFSDDIYFHDTVFKQFSGFTYIENSNGKIEIANVKFVTGKNDFSHINNVKDIQFIDCTMDSCSFIYSNLTNFKFINVTWLKNGKIFDEEFIKINWPKKKYKDKKAKTQELERQTHIKHTEEVYNQLKNKYRKENKHHLADQFYKGELEMKRIQHPGIFQWLSWEGLYKIFSNYGMSWKKPLCWVLAFFLLFSFITWIDGGITNHDTLALKWYDKSETKWVEGASLFQPPWFSKALYSLYYHFCNSLYVPQKTVEATTWLTQLLSRIENIIVTSLFILAGFAVRRKFRT